VRAQQEPERDQADVVFLSGRAREQRERSAAATPQAREREQLDFACVAQASVPEAKCGFCNAVGAPIPVMPAGTLPATVVLLLCKECGAVLAAVPHTRPDTLRP